MSEHNYFPKYITRLPRIARLFFKKIGFLHLAPKNSACADFRTVLYLQQIAENAKHSATGRRCQDGREQEDNNGWTHFLFIVDDPRHSDGHLWSVVFSLPSTQPTDFHGQGKPISDGWRRNCYSLWWSTDSGSQGKEVDIPGYCALRQSVASENTRMPNHVLQRAGKKPNAFE